jgi:hypothetical protein
VDATKQGWAGIRDAGEPQRAEDSEYYEDAGLRGDADGNLHDARACAIEVERAVDRLIESYPNPSIVDSLMLKGLADGIAGISARLQRRRYGE